jgi:hypothetical protein
MKKSFVLYTDQYEVLSHLSMLQKAWLFDAIFCCARGEEIPPKPDETASIAFGFIKQQLGRDAEKYEAFSRKQSENGKKGGRPRQKPDLSEESQETQVYSSKPTETQNNQTGTMTEVVTGTVIIGDKSPITPEQVSTTTFEIPAWLDRKTWEAFKKHRQYLRKSMSPKAVELIINKLKILMEQGENPKEVLEQSIERGWQGIFSTKENQNGTTSRTGYLKPSITDNVNDLLAKVDRGEL